AEAGFYLLWLIILGCFIKVFAQVEFGRFALVNGRTAMQGVNEAPGPRFIVSWILWFWLAMFLVSLGQLGGIVGGVGQAMAITWPLTEDGRRYNEIVDAEVERRIVVQQVKHLESIADP